MNPFRKSRDYKPLQDVPGPSHTSSDKKGSVLRFLVGDAEKRIAQDREVVRDELPNIKDKIGAILEHAQGIRQQGEYGDLRTFIIRVNEVKTWIDDHKKALGISMQEYQRIRKGYRDTRNTLEQYQGTRTNYASSFAAMDTSGQAVSAMRATSEDMNSMKRRVVDQAIFFLSEADTKLQSWNSSGDSLASSNSSSYASSDSRARSTYAHLPSSSDLNLAQRSDEGEQ